MVPYSLGTFSSVPSVKLKLKGHSSDLVLQFHKVMRLAKNTKE